MSWSDDPDEAIENLEDFGASTNAYCEKWKVKINSEKSQLIKITGLEKYESSRTRRLTKKARIAVNGVEPEYVDTVGALSPAGPVPTTKPVESRDKRKPIIVSPSNASRVVLPTQRLHSPSSTRRCIRQRRERETHPHRDEDARFHQRWRSKERQR